MSNFNYMTDIVEFGFADSFRKGLSSIGNKGKSVINNVKGSIGGAKKPFKPNLQKAVTPPGAPASASPYKRPKLNQVGYHNLTNTTKVTPGGVGSYKTKKNWYDP